MAGLVPMRVQTTGLRIPNAAQRERGTART
jgi:hypothetical protein